MPGKRIGKYMNKIPLFKKEESGKNVGIGSAISQGVDDNRKNARQSIRKYMLSTGREQTISVWEIDTTDRDEALREAENLVKDALFQFDCLVSQKHGRHMLIEQSYRDLYLRMKAISYNVHDDKKLEFEDGFQAFQAAYTATLGSGNTAAYRVALKDLRNFVSSKLKNSPGDREDSYVRSTELVTSAPGLRFARLNKPHGLRSDLVKSTSRQSLDRDDSSRLSDDDLIIGESVGEQEKKQADMISSSVPFFTHPEDLHESALESLLDDDLNEEWSQERNVENKKTNTLVGSVTANGKEATLFTSKSVSTDDTKRGTSVASNRSQNRKESTVRRPALKRTSGRQQLLARDSRRNRNDDSIAIGAEPAEGDTFSRVLVGVYETPEGKELQVLQRKNKELTAENYNNVFSGGSIARPEEKREKSIDDSSLKSKGKGAVSGAASESIGNVENSSFVKNYPRAEGLSKSLGVYSKEEEFGDFFDKAKLLPDDLQKWQEALLGENSAEDREKFMQHCIESVLDLFTRALRLIGYGNDGYDDIHNSWEHFLLKFKAYGENLTASTKDRLVDIASVLAGMCIKGLEYLNSVMDEACKKFQNRQAGNQM